MPRRPLRSGRTHRRRLATAGNTLQPHSATSLNKAPQRTRTFRYPCATRHPEARARTLPISVSSQPRNPCTHVRRPSPRVGQPSCGTLINESHRQQKTRPHHLNARRCRRCLRKRFDKLDEKIAATEKALIEKIDGVDSKVAGINRRLDAEAIQRTDLNPPRRVHDLEEEVYGTGRSKHPKHLPL